MCKVTVINGENSTQVSGRLMRWIKGDYRGVNALRTIRTRLDPATAVAVSKVTKWKKAIPYVETNRIDLFLLKTPKP